MTGCAGQWGWGEDSSELLPQVFVFSVIPVSTAHRCSSLDNSQLCFSDQIVPRDVENTKVLKTMETKEMSKTVSSRDPELKAWIGGGGLYCLSSFTQLSSAWSSLLYGCGVRTTIWH